MTPAMKLLLRALTEGERLNKHAVATKLGLHLSTADRMLNALHAAGQVHVVGWTRNGDRGPMTKIVAFGPGQDVPRPGKLDNAYICQRWRDRHPEQVQQSNRRYEIKRKVRRGTLPRGNDPLLFAILGMSA